MAAAAAVAVSSSLSTSLKCIRFRNWSSDPTARISSSSNKFFIKMGLISQTHSTEAFVPVLAQKWRVPRVSAAVAQEEAAVEAAAEEAVEEEVSGGGEGEGEGGGAVINTKLYFGNLPYHCDSAQLAGIIQEYGEPELVEVLYNKDTGKSRGYAFVTMSSVEDCNAVIKNLDGSEYGGRILRVNFSDKPKPRNQPLYPETEHKLFIGNLAWTVTTESLTQAFQQYGNVVGARVVYDGETGRSRGYAFVSYATRSEMEAALESLNGVDGQKVGPKGNQAEISDNTERDVLRLKALSKP
ncbi:hypothetical protein RHSIM_Rhsim04G0172200 [Rhododendron simsii]|uniref:RRM domain-containing protein n=1 Tax=Rhododendron simsii TaxID=118357 RepID=A0A834HDW0_RHOSS|nr:hypothetical protein RHSIM_Rhsim04G0172200 [Rhododendron simsii]